MDYKEVKFQTCPYLGLRSDPGTALSFPSHENFCFHGKTERSVSLEHQEEFCLNNNHTACDVYSSNTKAPLPVSNFTDPKEGKPGKVSRKKVTFGFMMVAVGIMVIWVLLTDPMGLIPTKEIPTAPAGITATTRMPSQTEVPPSDTPSVTLISTKTLRLALGLETPLGLNHRFVIHTIQSGESLEFLARDYGTTKEAILACNYQLLSPLLPGVVIVVPLNFADMDGIPPFESYRVMRETSIIDLASQLMVDLEEFKYYNTFSDETILHIDDWVLVPRTATAVP